MKYPSLLVSLVLLIFLPGIASAGLHLPGKPVVRLHRFAGLQICFADRMTAHALLSFFQKGNRGLFIIHQVASILAYCSINCRNSISKQSARINVRADSEHSSGCWRMGCR